MLLLEKRLNSPRSISISHHVSVIHGDFRAPTAAVAQALGMEVVRV